MLLKQMRYFCAVVEEGGFTRTADACGVSQPAISQQMHALEEELGTDLLRREGRRVEPTEAGRALYQGAHDIVERADRLVSQVRAIATGAPSTLRVGYLSRYEGWEIQGAVAAFALRHPDIAVTAVSGSHDALCERVMAGEVDLVFNDKRRAFSDAFVNRHLMTCYDYVEVSEGSPLAWCDCVRVEQLEGMPCILISSEDQHEVERAFYRDFLGFDCEFRFVRTIEEGRMMVAGNQGFMLLEAREDTPRVGTVVRRIPLVGPAGRLRQDYYAFWPKGGSNPLIEEFADILAGLFA